MEKQFYKLVAFLMILTLLLFSGVTFASGGWVMYDNFDAGTIDGAKWVTIAGAPVANSGGVSFTGGGAGFSESNLEVLDFGTAIGAQVDLQLISFTPSPNPIWVEGQIELEMDLGGGYGAAIEILTEDGVDFCVEMAVERDFGGDHIEIVSSEFDITAGQTVKAGIVFHDDTDSLDFYIDGSLLWSYDSLHAKYDPVIAAGFSLEDLIIGCMGSDGQFDGFADNMELYVPEPATVTMLGLGVLVMRRKRKV